MSHVLFPDPPPPGLEALRQRHVTAGGLRVAYTEAGPMDGPTVVLLHGAVFAGNAFQWEAQATLAPHVRTVAPDFPGWGASDKPHGAYDMAAYHGHIGAFLDALGLEKVAIVGHSMGGLLGSAYALLHPHRVDALATVAVPPAWVMFGIPDLFRPFLLLGFGEVMLSAMPFGGPDLPMGVRRYYEGLFHDRAAFDPVRMRDVLQNCCDTARDPAHRRAFLGTLRANHVLITPANRERFADLVAANPVPTLLIAGQNDPMFSPGLVASALEAAPHARLEILERCGHFPMWERRAVVEGLLMEFLTDQGYNGANPAKTKEMTAS